MLRVTLQQDDGQSGRRYSAFHPEFLPEVRVKPSGGPDNPLDGPLDRFGRGRRPRPGVLSQEGPDWLRDFGKCR